MNNWNCVHSGSQLFNYNMMSIRCTARPLRVAAIPSMPVRCNSTLKSASLQPLSEKGELQLYKLADLAGVYAVRNCMEYRRIHWILRLNPIRFMTRKRHCNILA